MLHGSVSGTLPQTEQKWTAACILRMASASSFTVSGGCRSMWNVSRCVVFGPIPGCDANASTARAIGSMVCTLGHAGQLHAAGERAELVGRRFLSFAQRLVDGSHDQVLERLDVFGIDRFR